MNDTDSSLKKSSLSKSTLKNSAQISSVPLIVSELVYNSLSADAQSIAVRLELNRQKLQVVDNGIGMTEIQLNQLPARDKTHFPHQDGFASYPFFQAQNFKILLETCQNLMIISRTRNSDESYFRVSFSLRDNHSGALALQLKKNDNLMARFCCAYPEVSISSLIEVSANNEIINVSGVISRNTNHENAIQLVYINKRLIVNSFIRDLINFLLSKSFFLSGIHVKNKGRCSKVPINDQILSKIPCLETKPSESRSPTASPIFQKSKHAVFAIDITCISGECSIVSSPKSTEVIFSNQTAFFDCLQRVIQQFLVSESNLKPAVFDDEKMKSSDRKTDCNQPPVTLTQEPKSKPSDQNTVTTKKAHDAPVSNERKKSTTRGVVTTYAKIKKNTFCSFRPNTPARQRKVRSDDVRVLKEKLQELVKKDKNPKQLLKDNARKDSERANPKLNKNSEGTLASNTVNNPQVPSRTKLHHCKIARKMERTSRVPVILKKIHGSPDFKLRKSSRRNAKTTVKNSERIHKNFAEEQLSPPYDGTIPVHDPPGNHETMDNVTFKNKHRLFKRKDDLVPDRDITSKRKKLAENVTVSSKPREVEKVIQKGKENRPLKRKSNPESVVTDLTSEVIPDESKRDNNATNSKHSKVAKMKSGRDGDCLNSSLNFCQQNNSGSVQKSVSERNSPPEDGHLTISCQSSEVENSPDCNTSLCGFCGSSKSVISLDADSKRFKFSEKLLSDLGSLTSFEDSEEKSCKTKANPKFDAETPLTGSSSTKFSRPHHREEIKNKLHSNILNVQKSSKEKFKKSQSRKKTKLISLANFLRDQSLTYHKRKKLFVASKVAAKNANGKKYPCPTDRKSRKKHINEKFRRKLKRLKSPKEPRKCNLGTMFANPNLKDHESCNSSSMREDGHAASGKISDKIEPFTTNFRKTRPEKASRDLNQSFGNVCSRMQTNVNLPGIHRVVTPRDILNHDNSTRVSSLVNSRVREPEINSKFLMSINEPEFLTVLNVEHLNSPATPEHDPAITPPTYKREIPGSVGEKLRARFEELHLDNQVEVAPKENRKFASKQTEERQYLPQHFRFDPKINSPGDNIVFLPRNGGKPSHSRFFKGNKPPQPCQREFSPFFKPVITTVPSPFLKSRPIKKLVPAPDLFLSMRVEDNYKSNFLSNNEEEQGKSVDNSQASPYFVENFELSPTANTQTLFGSAPSQNHTSCDFEPGDRRNALSFQNVFRQSVKSFGTFPTPMLHSNLLFTTASKLNRKFCDVSSPLNRDRLRGFQSSNQSARTSPTTTHNTVSFINTEVSSQVDSHFQQNASQYDSNVRCSMNSSSTVDERFSASAGDTEDYLEAPLDLSVKKSSPATLRPCVTSLEETLLDCNPDEDFDCNPDEDFDCNPDEDFDRHQEVDHAEPSYFQIRNDISPSRVNVQPLSTDCLKRRMEELKNSKETHEEYIDAPRNYADPLENTEARNNHSHEEQVDDTPNHSIESTHTQSISPLRILETPNQKFPPDQDFSQPSSSFRDCEFAPLRARVTPKCSGIDELNRSHCDESIFSDDVTPKCSGLDELNRSHCDESIFSDDVTPKCSGLDELNRSHCDESIFSDDVTPKCSGHDGLDRSHRNESIFSDSQHSPEKEGEDKMMEETLFESACHPSDDPLSEDINDCCRGLENMFISISGSAENMAASSNATYGFPDAQNLQTDGTVNLISTDEIESMVSQFAEEDRTQIQQAGKIITDQESYNTNAQITSDRRTPKLIQATSIVVHATSGMSFILPSIQNALLLPETSIDSRGNPHDELVLEDNHFQFVEKEKRNFPEDADQDAFWGMLSRFDTLTSKFCTLKSKGLGNLEKGHVENESSNISLSVLSRSVLEDTLAKSMGTSRELFVFEKKLFNALEVVGQLDSKFILTILEVSKSRLIVAFDQHAVDERIRVEKLMNDYCVDFKAKVWKSVCVNPVIIMIVSTERAILCENFKSAFQKVGLVFSVNGRKLTITRIPLCLFNSAQRNNDALLDLTCSLLNEMVQSIVDLNGVYPSIPNCILSAINEEACKRAVKFGDKLTHFQCKALLEGLKTCRFPFQCAHGRPLLFPIANLNLLSD